MLQQLRHLCAIPPTLLVLSLALLLGGELLSQQPLASHQSCTQTASFGCLSSSSDISCAKLTPPLTLSRAWNAASHFLHLFVPCWSFGVRTTLTVRSAKRHPHQVSHSAKAMFHDVRRIRRDTFPCRPVETAQHCSGPSGESALFEIIHLDLNQEQIHSLEPCLHGRQIPMDPSIGICEKNAMLAHGVTAKGSMYTHGDYFQLNEQQAFRVEAAAAADGKYILLGKKLDVCHHMNHVITKWTPPNSKGALWVLPLEKILRAKRICYHRVEKNESKDIISLLVC